MLREKAIKNKGNIKRKINLLYRLNYSVKVKKNAI